jgi:fucose 4-O-acetylase-like acetyltransferase
MILSAIGIITRPSMVTVIREVFYIGQPVSILSGHLWFLVCMFIVVITYYIITDLFKSNRQIIIILILCAIAGEIYSKFSPFQLPFKIGSAFSALVFYGAGNLFREFKGDFEIMFKFKILIVIVSTFASGFVLGVYINKSVNMADTQYNNVFLFYAAAFLGIILIFIISKLINKNRFLEFFGRNSLVIYGTHFYIAYCVVKTISVITRSTFMLFCLPYGVGLLASVCVIVLEIPVVFIANKLSELKNTKLNIIRRH